MKKVKDKHEIINNILVNTNLETNFNENDQKNLISSKPSNHAVAYYQLFKYTNGFDRVIIFLMILTSFGIGIAFPLNMLIFKDVVNIIVNPKIQNSYSDVLRPLIINFAILASATFVCGFIQMVCVSVIGTRQNQRYKSLYYSALLRQEMSWFDVQQTGQLMTKMTDDIESIEIATADKLAQFVQQMSSFIGSIILALISGWKLSLAACAAIPIIVLAFSFSVHFIKKFSISQIRAYSLAGGIAEEILSGIRTVVAFNAQEREVKRYSINLGLAEKYGIKKAICQGIGIGLIGFTVFSIGSLVFYLGIHFIKDGEYQPGVVIQIFITIVIGSVALGNASTMIENFMVAKAAAYPIFEVIDRNPSISIVKLGIIPDKFNDDIHFKNVNFEYPARIGVPILENFTFTIPHGKTVAFIGPSGSGKSTIIHLLQRFYDPDSGTVSLGSTNLKDLDLIWYRSHIGVVQQEPLLFTGTVEENIRLGKETANFDEIVKVTQDSNAYEFIMETKEQFNTELGDLGSGFSGGQKQRIAIATALIRGPSLLLLDEATSALDNKSEKLVQSTLDQTIISGKKTVVMVAHRLQTVRNADIIVVMKSGKIIEQGNHDELVAKKGLYYKMLQIQKSKESVEEEELLLPNTDSKDLLEYSRRRFSSLILPDSLEYLDKSTHFQMLKDFIRIIQFNKPEACILSVGVIASTIVGAAFPCASLIYSEMYKIFTYRDDPEKMLKYGHFFCGLMLIPAFALLISQFLKHSCLGTAGEALTTRIRSKLMEAMLKQEMAWFDKPENLPGVLTGRLALDASLVKGTVGIQLSVFIEAATNVILSLFIGFYSSWMLTLLFFLFIPFITLSGIMQGQISSNQKLTGLESIQSSSLIMETLNNIRTVHSLGLQDYFSTIFSKSLKTKSKRAHLNLFFYGITSAFGLSSLYYAYCVMFYVGAILIDNRTIEMIQLMRVFACFSLSSAALGRALALAPDVDKARLATRRTLEIINRVTNIDAYSFIGLKPSTKLVGNIEFKNIYFRYPTRLNVNVLKSFNLKIEAGQTVALVGHSGCGKSTLIQLLERYYDPLQPNNKDIGQILLDGHEYKSLNLAWIRNQIGLVKQEPSLLNLTIAENISYGSNTEFKYEDIIHVAKMSNIHDFIESLPEGYNTKVGQRGSHLSGGQKQRICIARALYNKPAILLLDEATSALDTESEKVVQEALDRARENCTCLIIAHRLSTIQNADKIVVIENGTVAEIGTHEELMSIRGRYFDLNVQHIN